MSVKRTKIRKIVATIATGASLLLTSTLLFAEYVPYPGKLEVNVLNVEAPNIIFVNFESWPGFPHSVRILLPGIVVPEDTPQAEDCEREKVLLAMAFTGDFLADADKVYVKDMHMETSASQEAISPILTNKGSLGPALVTAGLARADHIDASVSWCD